MHACQSLLRFLPVRRFLCFRESLLLETFELVSALRVVSGLETVFPSESVQKAPQPDVTTPISFPDLQSARICDLRYRPQNGIIAGQLVGHANPA